MSPTLITIVAPQLVELAAEIIRRHTASLPEMTQAEMITFLESTQSKWQQDEADALALERKGHTE